MIPPQKSMVSQISSPTSTMFSLNISSWMLLKTALKNSPNPSTLSFSYVSSTSSFWPSPARSSSASATSIANPSTIKPISIRTSPFSGKFILTQPVKTIWSTHLDKQSKRRKSEMWRGKNIWWASACNQDKSQRCRQQSSTFLGRAWKNCKDQRIKRNWWNFFEKYFRRYVRPDEIDYGKLWKNEENKHCFYWTTRTNVDLLQISCPWHRLL